MAENKELTGPDFARGISLTELTDGSMVQGHVKGERILVAQRGDNYFAIGAICTHYGAPLATGIIVDDTVRCPWHHACFSLRTGEALRAPALDPVTCWKVETRDGKLFVRKKEPEKEPSAAGSAKMPENVLIVGGGAAGNAAAEMLRREGYRGDLTLLSADDSVPYDRPTLSKDFLNGSASEKMIPLRSKDFYKKHAIELLLKTRIEAIDPQNKAVQLVDGKQRKFDALLLATGAGAITESCGSGAGMKEAAYPSA
jgi:apoptosis-inducing factor 3